MFQPIFFRQSFQLSCNHEANFEAFFCLPNPIIKNIKNSLQNNIYIERTDANKSINVYKCKTMLVDEECQRCEIAKMERKIPCSRKVVSGGKVAGAIKSW